MSDLTPYKKRFGKEVARFRDEMDNLFNRFFDMEIPFSKRFFGDTEWSPRLDVSEGKGEILVKAEIPGCEAEDLDVSIEGRLLTIKGEKRQEKEEKEESYHRIERSYGSFSRTVELPAEVDPDTIDATYKNGVLKMVLKKTVASETRKIEIKAG